MNRKKTMFRISVITACVLIVCTFLSKSVYTAFLPRITTITADRGVVDHNTYSEGRFYYDDISVVKALGDWRIVECMISEGGYVEKGASLFRVEIEDYELKHAELELSILRIENSIQELDASQAKSDNVHSGNSTAQAEIKIERERAELIMLADEIQILEAEVSNLKNGTYESLKISEYELNIKIAGDTLADTQILYEVGAESMAKLEEAEMDYGRARMQLEQYIQSETDIRSELIKSKTEQMESVTESINEKLYSVEQEKQYNEVDAINRVIDSEGLNRSKRLLIAELTLNQTKLKSLTESLPENGIVTAPVAGWAAGVNVEEGDFIGKGAELLSMQKENQPVLVQFRLPMDTGLFYDAGSRGNFSVLGKVMGINGKPVVDNLTGTFSIEEKVFVPESNEWEFSATIEDCNGEPIVGSKVDIYLTRKYVPVEIAVTIPASCVIPVGEEKYVVYESRTRNGLFGVETYVYPIQVELLDNNNDRACVKAAELYPGMNEVVRYASSPLSDGMVVVVEDTP